MFDFSESKYSKKGIYAIVNRLNGQFYIGSTRCKRGFKERFSTHLRELRKKKHHSYKLQKAWNQYGEANFSFYILREIDDSENKNPDYFLKLEQQYLDTYKPAYNVAKFTQPLKYKSKEEKRKNYKKHSKYKFIVKSPKGIVEEVYSLREYAEKHNLDQSTLTKVANGIRKFHKGYTVKKVAL